MIAQVISVTLSIAVIGSFIADILFITWRIIMLLCTAESELYCRLLQDVVWLLWTERRVRYWQYMVLGYKVLCEVWFWMHWSRAETSHWLLLLRWNVLLNYYEHGQMLQTDLRLSSSGYSESLGLYHIYRLTIMIFFFSSVLFVSRDRRLLSVWMPYIGWYKIYG